MAGPRKSAGIFGLVARMLPAIPVTVETHCGTVARRLIGLITLVAMIGGAAESPDLAPASTNPPPKRVLILDSFGFDAAPFSAAIAVLRTTLAKELAEPVDIYDES